MNNTQYRLWQDDNSIKNCNVCSEKFTFLFRKHHCRKCGLIICENCSIICASITDKDKIRICNKCEQTINIYNKSKSIHIQTEIDSNFMEKILYKSNRCDVATQTYTEYFEKNTQTIYKNENIQTQTDNINYTDIQIQTDNINYESDSNSESEFYESIPEDNINTNIVSSNDLSGKDSYTSHNTEIYIEEKVKKNESTKERVLKKKMEKKEEEERNYLLEFNKAQDQYKDKIKYLKKGEFFEVSNN